MKMFGKRIILLVALLMSIRLLAAQDLSAADSVSFRIYHRMSRVAVDSTYMRNDTVLQQLHSFLQQAHRIDSIHIRSFASPDGPYWLNRRYAEQRADRLCAYLQQCIEQYKGAPLPASQWRLTPVPENWEGLYQLVNESYHRPDRTQVLRLLLTRRIDDTHRKLELQQLDEGRTWQYIMQHYMPRLRHSSWMMIYTSSPQPVVEGTLMQVPAQEAPVQPDTMVVAPDTLQPEPLPIAATPREPLVWAVKTNALYDLLLVPNIGVEFPLYNNVWSVGANWHYAWWHNDNKHWYWRTYGGELALRRWWKAVDEQPLTGHHLGLYAQLLTYDMELGGRGYQSDGLSYAVGVEYGYSMPLKGPLRLDFVLGIGYQGGKYKEYKPQDDHYVWQSTKNRQWFGPTKAEVSLVWLFNATAKQQKGGLR